MQTVIHLFVIYFYKIECIVKNSNVGNVVSGAIYCMLYTVFK